MGSRHTHSDLSAGGAVQEPLPDSDLYDLEPEAMAPSSAYKSTDDDDAVIVTGALPVDADLQVEGNNHSSDPSTAARGVRLVAMSSYSPNIGAESDGDVAAASEAGQDVVPLFTLEFGDFILGGGDEALPVTPVATVSEV